MIASEPVSTVKAVLPAPAERVHGRLQRPRFHWSDLWKAPLHDFPIRDEILLSYLPFFPEMSVLEAGPGSGFTAYWLARQARHLTLLDAREEAVVELRQTFRAVKNVDVVRWDLSAPGLGDVLSRRFDAVFGLDVFEYIPSVSACLANIRSVLRPGGCLFLTFPNVPPPQGDGVTWFLDASELDALLLSAGFGRWDIFATRMTPFAKWTYRFAHEWPLQMYRRVRKGDRNVRPQTYEATWAFRNRKAWLRYRWCLHLCWGVLAPAMRMGGRIFEADESRDGLVGCQLVVRAWR